MRWSRPALTVPTHGEGEVELRLRNLGNPAWLRKDRPNEFRVALTASPGIRLDPEEIRVTDLAPGGELRRTVRFSTREAAPNTALAIEAAVDDAGAQPYRASPARLEISSGVRVAVEQIRPRDFARVVTAPRYTLKMYYMRTVAAGYVLDPDGMRRFGSGAIPQLSVLREDERGRLSPQRQTLGGYNAFSPSLRDGREGEPKFLADMGQHPHGARSPFEMRFTEDWWWLRYKDGDGQRVAYDFGGGDERFPGADSALAAAALPALRLLADAEGRIVPLQGRPAGLPISASFVRPAGYRYGRVTLLPEGTTREGNLNVGPGDQAVAFTFATEEEFAGLVDAWRSGSPPVPVRPWGQGDMNQ